MYPGVVDAEAATLEVAHHVESVVGVYKQQNISRKLHEHH